MEEQLKSDFNKVIKNLKISNENLDLRKKNLDKFIKDGFPNKKIEDWKFSDLNQIINLNIKKISFHNEILSSYKIDESIYINNFEHNKIIFLNDSIFKIDLSYEEKNKIEIIEDLNFKEKKNNANTLVSLNHAFLSSYIKLIVKQNYSFKKPLIIYYITNKDLTAKAINLRIDITLEDNSSLKLLNLFNDESENNFININQKFKLGRGAIFKNYKIDYKDNSNIKYIYNNIDLESNSVAETFIFSTGSKFIKNEINCNLKDHYSSAFINGIVNLKNS